METDLHRGSTLSESAILVQVHLPDSDFDHHDPLAELRALVESAGVKVAGELEQNMKQPRGATYLGKGKVEELGLMAKQLKAGVVIFDNDLSPSQLKGLEEALNCKVIDRSELILDIFANRASTRQAQLQVEIAQLQYTAPRLRAMWQHLGQVTGGSPMGVGTRGPGEQQIEIDRRIVKERLDRLRRELVEIAQRKEREVQGRRDSHFTVGLVGYTNAGKSTLFNALTRGGAFANDQLFATLGTRVEEWSLGGGNACMLSDTVGFIRDLPHHLVASFRSTLEDAIHAHLLLLLIDVSDRRAPQQLEVVEKTLEEIGATDQPRVLLLNKADRLGEIRGLAAKGVRPLDEWLELKPDAIVISAQQGSGLDLLKQRVMDAMRGELRTIAVTVPLKEARMIDFLEKRCQVSHRDYTDGVVTLTVEVGRRHVDLMLARGTQFQIEGMPAADYVRNHWEAAAAAVPRRQPPHERLADSVAIPAPRKKSRS
ncbi:MAG: GTPase HflX [Planctomycetes bacterium]|nr:GTPase HflX [Planctomycetota bacterium]